MPVALGGPHSTLFPKPILEDYKYIDYIVLGEGEMSFKELLRAHFADKRLLNEIDGIAYRKCSDIVVKPKTKFIEDLDTIPYPAYDLIDIKDYYFDTSDWHNPRKLPINHNFSMITSRGCPRQCTYCAMKHFHGLRYRMRSARNVVDEIQYLHDKYNCRYISFVDDNMAVNKKRVLEIMSGICRRKLNIQFDTSQGLEINTLDEEMLKAMVGAGFIRTAVGIEAGSEHIRNVVIKKNLKDKTIYNFFKMAAKYKNLRFVAFFICGFPQETEETLNATFEMIKKLPLDSAGLNILVPFYGTEMFKFCYERGLLNIDINNLHNMSFSFSEDFVIKPFSIDIAYLRDFRNKVVAYISEKKSYFRIIRKRKIEAIIFDLDNVLYEEIDYILSAYQDIACYLSKYNGIDENSIFEMLLKSFHEKTSIYPYLFNDLLSNLGLDASLLPEILNIYSSVRKKIKLYDGTEKILTYLRKEYKLGLLTNGNVKAQRNKVNLMRIDKFFNEILYARDLGKENEKPSEIAYSAILARLNTKPQNAVYIGDNPYIDFIGAKRLGILTVRVLTGEFKEVKTHKEQCVDIVVNSIGEFVDLLKRA
jgi:magnesium-protoporphyrin IX monomethyl ester (oxidative) cyclase